MWGWGAIGLGVVLLAIAIFVPLALLAGSGGGGGGGGGDHARLTVPGVPGGVDMNAGPPQWVKPGTRITFYAAAASVAQSRYAWVEDSNGTWEDPKTGKRYRRTDESGESMGTSSGDGYDQVDVVAVDGPDVVFTLKAYTINRTDPNSVTFLPPIVTGGKTSGTVVDGTWMNPDVLAQLQNMNEEGLMVLRGPYPLNGVTYNAISFAFSGAGGYQQYTYDTQTGVLLSSTTSTKGATSPVHAQGEAAPQGNTELTVTYYVSTRQLPASGYTGTNPGWVASTNQLHYTGAWLQTNPLDPSTLPVSFPMDLQVTLGERGRNWATYTSHQVVQGLVAQTNDSAGVTSTAGGYWVDPQGLAAVQPQQVLDNDPIIQEQVQVASVDAGNGARGPTVTISDRVPGVETTTTYQKATGVLVHYKQVGLKTGTTIELDLQGGP